MGVRSWSPSSVRLPLVVTVAIDVRRPSQPPPAASRCAADSACVWPCNLHDSRVLLVDVRRCRLVHRTSGGNSPAAFQRSLPVRQPMSVPCAVSDRFASRVVVLRHASPRGRSWIICAQFDAAWHWPSRSSTVRECWSPFRMRSESWQPSTSRLPTRLVEAATGLTSGHRNASRDLDHLRLPPGVSAVDVWASLVPVVPERTSSW